MKYEVGLDEQQHGVYSTTLMKSKFNGTSGILYITDKRIVFAKHPLWLIILCIGFLILLPLIFIIKGTKINNQILLKDIKKITLGKVGKSKRYTIHTNTGDSFEYMFYPKSEQEILSFIKAGVEKATGKKVSATSDIINFI